MAPNLFEIPILKMIMDHNGPVVERAYRETSRLQWAREVYKNAAQANATRVHFGVEWQGVVSKNVYRRAIADDGAGMSGDELKKFFNTFGGGGKPIGGAHENYGIGAKTSLLPWNHLGVVVLSRKNGKTNMIRIRRDGDGDYGLHRYEILDEDENTIKSFVVPLDDYEEFFDENEDLGIDWCKALDDYDWIEEHGTVIVLLGNEPNQDTINGDPNRDEGGVRPVLQYLNERLWESELKIEVLEFASAEKATWPKSKSDKRSETYYKYTDRRVYGAKYFIAEPSTYPKMAMKSGTVAANNGVKIDWYLWDWDFAKYGEKGNGGYPRDNRGPRYGSISVLYDNELYDVRDKLPAFRSFGVAEATVWKNLWLVIRPPAGEPGTGQIGVFPRADRSSLDWYAKQHGGVRLPWHDWEDSFKDRMPAEIIEAMRKARPDQASSIEDEAWMEKVAARFGSRIRLPRFRPDDNGAETSAEPSLVTRVPGRTTQTETGKKRRKRKKSVRNTRRPGFAVEGDSRPASRTSVRGGLPNCIFSDDAENFEPGMAVTWTEPTRAADPQGLITIYRGHAMFQHIVKLFQKDFPGYQADRVRDAVEKIYKMAMIVRVAMIHGNMRRFVDEEQYDRMLMPEALTTALLGVAAEDAMVRQELVKTLGRKRQRPRAQIELPSGAVALTAMPAAVM